jgi:hypothetical protein
MADDTTEGTAADAPSPDALPAPPVPDDVDLRHYRTMPLDVVALRGSELISDETPEACWAALRVWAAAWHQVPAASIPDNEQWIAQQAGYVVRGRLDVDGWAEVRRAVMRHWTRCADGRLYHATLAEHAISAWNSARAFRYERMRDRMRKMNKALIERGEPPMTIPGKAEWYARGCVDPTKALANNPESAPDSTGKTARSTGNADGSTGKSSPVRRKRGQVPVETGAPSGGNPAESGLNRTDQNRTDIKEVPNGTSQEAPNGASDSGGSLTDPPGPVPTPAPPPPIDLAPPPPPAAKAPRRAKEKEPAPSSVAWDAYAAAFATRYGVAPTRNASTNALMAQVVGKVGADDAPDVAALYVRTSNPLYVNAAHAVNLLLRDAEKLHMLVRRGREGGDLALVGESPTIRGASGATSWRHATDAERRAESERTTAEAMTLIRGGRDDDGMTIDV